ncbi:glycosyltransferase family 2 protein [Pseudovibrio sp. SPO723]|uniref:glycosyltransferase family 2 protein n=1 Tax=Nesiotobacter zosterae TaxID=392721 RepID=UPI0029C3E93D|nr:glycosyltransferase [Pseudovibrio sp. SPO723]MDX5592442.1 glycosyltransferase [Pseudovibrio sp. SPO723]
MTTSNSAHPVTVLIPARNAEATLAQTLESLKTQTFRRFEVLVVNDGSSDRTAQVVTAFQRKMRRLQMIDGPAKGISAALNQGLQQISSPFVARLDADDLADPTRLGKQLAALEDNPNWVLCGSDVSRIDEAGAPLGGMTSPTTPEAIAHRLWEKNCLYHPSIMFRREAVMRVGGYRSLYDGAEDYDLYLRLCEIGELASLPEMLTAYRIHSGQVTQDPNRQYRQIADAVLLNALRKRAGLAEFSELPKELGLFLASEVMATLSRPETPLSPRVARHMLARCKKAGAEIGLAKQSLVRSALSHRNFQETLKALAL